MSQDPDDETLPTVLVYRGGELETTWVRFDLELEKGRGGLEGRDARRLVEEVLLRYVVLVLSLFRTLREEQLMFELGLTAKEPLNRIPAKRRLLELQTSQEEPLTKTTMTTSSQLDR